MRKNPRKIKRIVRYKEENPTLTLQQIGRRFKTSKQYIHKALKNQNIPTAIRVRKKKVGYCLECTNVIYKESQYIKRVCSTKCHFKYFNIKITCDYCRTPFYRKRSTLIQRSVMGYKHSFCTLQCFYRAQRAGIT
mgnify:FL=1